MLRVLEVAPRVVALVTRAVIRLHFDSGWRRMRARSRGSCGIFEKEEKNTSKVHETRNERLLSSTPRRCQERDTQIEWTLRFAASRSTRRTWSSVSAYRYAERVCLSLECGISRGLSLVS